MTIEASRASLTPLSVPVFASALVLAVPRIPRTDTLAALALPETVDAAVGNGSAGGKSPPSCARPAEGHASKAIARAIAIKHGLRDSV